MGKEEEELLVSFVLCMRLKCVKHVANMLRKGYLRIHKVHKSAANIIHIFDLNKYLSDKIKNLMEINERINMIIEHEKLNIASFARAIGIADQTVRSVCVIRRNKPSFDFLNKIVHAFEWVNPEWLLTGRGEMCRSNETSDKAVCTPDLSELVNYMREKDKRIEKLIEEKAFWQLRCEMRTQ